MQEFFLAGTLKIKTTLNFVPHGKLCINIIFRKKCYYPRTFNERPDCKKSKLKRCRAWFLFLPGQQTSEEALNSSFGIKMLFLCRLQTGLSPLGHHLFITYSKYMLHHLFKVHACAIYSVIVKLPHGLNHTDSRYS